MNIAIILSGGVGSRMGLNTPKQFVTVNERPILSYSLTTFLHNKMIAAVVIGCANEWKEYVINIIGKINSHKPVFYAQPGETRQHSIYKALTVAKQYCNGDDDIVIIHDAARPLVSDELIEKCIKGCKNADGIMPVVAVKDTIYQSKDGKHIKTLLDRSELWNGQAPEAFKLRKYLKAHESMPHEELLKITGSTEIAFKAGLDCQMIEGDPINFKITSFEDLINFKNIIEKQEKDESLRFT